MKKTTFLFCLVSALMIILLSACNTNTEIADEPSMIENTIQSVSYFKDTIGYDAKELVSHFDSYNKAIAEIGYPDAGYKLWIVNEEEDSGIRFMVQGNWPNMEVYELIHDHELYQNAGEENHEYWNGLVSVEYHRFKKIN